MTSSACIGQITGLGKFGYILAVKFLVQNTQGDNNGNK